MNTRQAGAVGTVGLVLIEILMFAAQAAAQPIPMNRRTDWSYAGVRGGIPSYSQICHTFTPATGTASAVNAKITECGVVYPNGSVVLLSAGTYVWDTTVRVGASKVVLRGEGADKTIIQHAPTAAFVLRLGSSSAYVTTVNAAVTGGGTKDSFSFQLANASGLSTGEVIELLRDDEPYVHSNYPNTRLKQVNRITEVTGNVITVRNPLLHDFSGGNARVWLKWVRHSTNAGIEDLKIDHSTYTGTDLTTLKIAFCDECWIRGVESYKSRNYHFMVETALNFEFKDGYVHEASTYGSNNSGIVIAPGGSYGNVSNIKIENTIFDRNFPAIENFGGLFGSVIAYNFVSRPQPSPTSIFVTWGISDNHGPHNMLNLYEGNITPMLGSDGYYGGSSHSTFFRNLITGATTGLRGVVETGNPIWLKRLSYYYNIVGNVIGSVETAPHYYEEAGENCQPYWCTSPYQLGYPNLGNHSYDGSGLPYQPNPPIAYPDANVRSTLLRWGNYDFFHKAVRWEASEIPEGAAVPSDRNLPNSYYLTSKPSWFGSVAWPPIGPDVTATSHGGVGTEDASGHANKIPAQLCWESRNLIGGGPFSAAACYGSQPAPPANLKIR